MYVQSSVAISSAHGLFLYAQRCLKLSKAQEVLLVMEDSAGRHGGRKDVLCSGSKQNLMSMRWI